MIAPLIGTVIVINLLPLSSNPFFFALLAILVLCPVNISPLPDNAIEAMPIADAVEMLQDYSKREDFSPWSWALFLLQHGCQLVCWRPVALTSGVLAEHFYPTYTHQ